MSIMQEMFRFQEAEIGHSYDQVSRMFSTRVASKEELNKAYMRLIRLENSIQNVTGRLRAMVSKLESTEETKANRVDQMAGILESILMVCFTISLYLIPNKL